MPRKKESSPLRGRHVAHGAGLLIPHLERHAGNESAAGVGDGAADAALIHLGHQ
jgi:hypothetical protein